MEVQLTHLSSTIKSVAYDDAQQVMYVEYRTGAKYKWANIPKEIYFNVCRAPSPGRYLGLIAKHYAGEKV